MKLTDEQKEAILKLGDPDSDVESIGISVLDELVALGLLCKRPSDANLDFTDKGEDVYEELVRRCTMYVDSVDALLAFLYQEKDIPAHGNAGRALNLDELAKGIQSNHSLPGKLTPQDAALAVVGAANRGLLELLAHGGSQPIPQPPTGFSTTVVHQARAIRFTGQVPEYIRGLDLKGC